MKPIANGTHAKDIALHFNKLTETRVTPQIMAKTINQAKSLLEHGYTRDEVIAVIDHVVLVKKINMFSLGYVNSCINNILRELQDIHEREEAIRQKEKLRKELKETSNTTNTEVSNDGESTERNRQKAGRLGVQSRVREKFNFDMFEGQ